MPAIIAIPQILNERLTEEGAKALVAIVDRAVEESERVTLRVAEEKFEKRVAQIEAKIEMVEAKLISRIEVVKAELTTQMERNRADLIKWMFIFWVGQVTTITAIIFVFFKR